MAGFGPNEWLVYEMYQQYLKDPESVDKAWWDFFADYQPSESQTGPSTTSTTSTNGSTTTKSSNEPVAPPAPTPTDGSSGRASDVRSNGATERSEGESASESRRGPTNRPAASEPGASKERESSQPRREPSDSASTSPLRGAAARVVTNMEASLAV